MVEECKVVVVNSSKRIIRVERLERDGLISAEIPVFKGMSIPLLNDYVVCLFNGKKGYLLGELG